MACERATANGLARLGCVGLVLVALLAGPASASVSAPSDPGWKEQWGTRLVRLPEAWWTAGTGAGVVIATVDTGLADVRDLQGAAVPGWDFVGDDGQTGDDQGHGTEVASVIAARGDNGIGVAGACWGCRVMPVRVAARSSAPEDLVARGIRWAVDHGARVVSISLTAGGEPSAAEQDAVTYARARGVLLVASAGNTYSERAAQYPAALPGVVSVTGTDPSDRLYEWSTRGAWVTLAAPGCQAVDTPWGDWGTLCGSSVAPAVVAGVAGLMLSLDPALTPAQIVAALEKTAVPVDGIGGGRIDAYAALAALGLAPAEPVPAYTTHVEVETGTISGSVGRALELGAGVLTATLRSPSAERCSVTLLGAAALTATGGTRGLIVLSTRVAAGRYRLTVDCPPAPQPYTLEIRAPFPTR